MKNLISEIKENNQDFEFYPTTDEIIEKFYYSLEEKNFDLLEIGCGNGKVFKTIEKLEKENIDEKGRSKGGSLKTKYAIEKSTILLNTLPADISILGTDFLEQTLIDKEDFELK